MITNRLDWIFKLVKIGDFRECRQAVDVDNLFKHVEWLVNGSLHFTNVYKRVDHIIIRSANSGLSVVPQRKLESTLEKSFGYVVKHCRENHGYATDYWTEVRLPE